MEENRTLESAFKELEETVAAMENPEITLDDAMALYRKGVELLQFCNTSIDQVEKQMIELQASEGGQDGL